jgi:hypothetical protein
MDQHYRSLYEGAISYYKEPMNGLVRKKYRLLLS